MKNTIVASAAILSLSLSFQSCKKHEMPEGKTSYQTIEIVLDMNKSYQYSFGTIDDKTTITKQSDAFLVSELDKVGDALLFNYTPKTNFVGTDEVQVTMGEEVREDHHKKGPHHPNPLKALTHKKHHDCEKHDDDKKVYIFKFTINNIGIPIINESAIESHK